MRLIALAGLYIKKLAATQKTRPAEIIEHGKNGLLVPLGNYKSWAAAIEAFHHDRKWLSKLSSGAIERARSCFNASLMAENMVDFLQDVLQHSENHPAQRKTGLPPETSDVYIRQNRGYQRLPEGLRVWVRNRVGSSPRLCHWLLNRY